MGADLSTAQIMLVNQTGILEMVEPEAQPSAPRHSVDLLQGGQHLPLFGVREAQLVIKIPLTSINIDICFNCHLLFDGYYWDTQLRRSTPNSIVTLGSVSVPIPPSL